MMKITVHFLGKGMDIIKNFSSESNKISNIISGLKIVPAARVLLITGGTGSFGNSVIDKFLSTDIKEIEFSRDEKKQDDIQKYSKFSNKLKFYIGDIRDLSSIDEPVME